MPSLGRVAVDAAPFTSTQLCEVCLAAAASLVCCNDEAALCTACDDSIHVANSITGKHVRLAFQPPTQPVRRSPQVLQPTDANSDPAVPRCDRPACDVCQQAYALVHCRQDRSYLCQKCDSRLHSASAVAAQHDRFYLTTVRVDLNPMPEKGAPVGRAAALKARHAAAAAAAAAATAQKEARALARARASVMTPPQNGGVSGGATTAATRRPGMVNEGMRMQQGAYEEVHEDRLSLPARTSFEEAADGEAITSTPGGGKQQNTSAEELLPGLDGAFGSFGDLMAADVPPPPHLADMFGARMGDFTATSVQMSP